MLKFAVLIFQREFCYTELSSILKPTKICGRNVNVSVVPCCVASLKWAAEKKPYRKSALDL